MSFEQLMLCAAMHTQRYGTGRYGPPAAVSSGWRTQRHCFHHCCSFSSLLKIRFRRTGLPTSFSSATAGIVRISCLSSICSITFGTDTEQRAALNIFSRTHSAWVIPCKTVYTTFRTRFFFSQFYKNIFTFFSNFIAKLRTPKTWLVLNIIFDASVALLRYSFPVKRIKFSSYSVGSALGPIRLRVRNVHDNTPF